MLNSLQWSQTDVRNTQKAKPRNIKHKRTILIYFLFFFFFFFFTGRCIQSSFWSIHSHRQMKTQLIFVTYQKFNIRYWRSGHSHILFQNKKPVASVWLFFPQNPCVCIASSAMFPKRKRYCLRPYCLVFSFYQISRKLLCLLRFPCIQVTYSCLHWAEHRTIISYCLFPTRLISQFAIYKSKGKLCLI